MKITFGDGILACMSLDFGIFMPKHLAEYTLLNSYSFCSVSMNSKRFPLVFPQFPVNAFWQILAEYKRSHRHPFQVDYLFASCLKHPFHLMKTPFMYRQQDLRNIRAL